MRAPRGLGRKVISFGDDEPVAHLGQLRYTIDDRQKEIPPGEKRASGQMG